MGNEFMNTETLATFTGLVTAVCIIVQFTKSVIKKRFGDEMVRFYTFVISLCLIFIFTNTNMDIRGIVLNIINSILITFASNGAYEALADPKAEKQRSLL